MADKVTYEKKKSKRLSMYNGDKERNMSRNILHDYENNPEAFDDFSNDEDEDILDEELRKKYLIE